jgi:hypothetical protein
MAGTIAQVTKISKKKSCNCTILTFLNLDAAIAQYVKKKNLALKFNESDCFFGILSKLGKSFVQDSCNKGE